MSGGHAPMHILVLTDRDWTHPQAGGTGTVLHALVTRWLDLGHTVTVVTSSYRGALAEERDGRLSIHRGSRLKTAVPSVAWRAGRRLASDADVALEIVNGVFFMTPLWLRTPCVTYVQHLSGGAQYRHEFGRSGGVLGFILETAPLRTLYRGRRFITISEATAAAIAAHGIPPGDVSVNHIGLYPDDFAPRVEAPEPALICLGRLKRYKNIEALLDFVGELEGVRLDVVGDGDHRAALERETERRGLKDRVRFHGFVPEEEKRDLLARAWVNMTASTAEGWGLSVTEAAACGTPSVALATGGLQEAIVDGRTGFLARDVAELGSQTRRLLDDDALRARLGGAALEQARTYTWEATAERALDALAAERTRAGGRPAGLQALAASDTGRAVGLAAAAMATNVIGLVLTVVFARLLGADGYGTLAALMSAFLILALPGQALQVTVAREVSREFLGRDPNLAGNVRRWMRAVLVTTAAVGAAGALLREPLADAIGVDTVWGAAAVPASACAWLLLSIQRGVLQGIGAYRVVAWSLILEACVRLIAGAVLIGAGLGPTGAFLGTAASVIAMAAVLSGPLHRRLTAGAAAAVRSTRRLRDLTRRAAVPLASLALMAWLQNVDVIVVKHQAPSDAAASSYAAASVAGKMVVWIGVGLGLFLLPEVARRAGGESDARPLLARSLAVVAAVGVPMVAFYAIAGRPLLETVFGPDLGVASGALPWLGVAMTFLTFTYLAVQFMLGMGRAAFLPLLAAAAVAEPFILLAIGPHLTEIALALCALQLALAAALATLAVRRGPSPASTRPQEAP